MIMIMVMIMIMIRIMIMIMIMLVIIIIMTELHMLLYYQHITPTTSLLPLLSQARKLPPSAFRKK